ncbi:MAG: hypothetical protein AB7N80_05530 [Bdellovibrionales bacterium]
MKKLILTLSAFATLLALAACDKKSGGGDKFVTAANSCFNYTYNQQYGYYTDTNGNRVNCEQGQFNGLNNFVPYNQMINGQFFNGCSSWSQVYPGSFYVPVNIQGYGAICVKQNYMTTLPGFNQYYNYYGTFPTQARSCRYGMNCGNCYGGVNAGVNVGNQFAGFWLGGTLALCW